MWFEQKIAKDAKTRESPNLFAAFATFVFLPLRQFCGFAALGSLVVKLPFSGLKPGP
jgi:hypothetical protein